MEVLTESAHLERPRKPLALRGTWSVVEDFNFEGFWNAYECRPLDDVRTYVPQQNADVASNLVPGAKPQAFKVSDSVSEASTALRF